MMDAIKVMMDEHQVILKTLKTARKMCKNILNNDNWEVEDFFKIIDFVRNYADKYHHGKEEVFLFKYMGEELRPSVTEGPIKGMLIEHDLGRLYMTRLEEALINFKNGENDARLDIIANTICYTHLLNHHITTEDNTLYPFANNRLKPETLKRLEEEVERIEVSSEGKETQEKYINLVNELEKKYIKAEIAS